MHTIKLVVALLLASAAAWVDSGHQAGRETREPACASEIDAARRAAAAAEGRGRYRMRPELDRAMALFRFHRRSEALSKLSRVETLRQEYGRGLPDEKGTALLTSVGRLRDCITRSSAAPLATLTVRVFMGGDSPDDRGPPVPGVLVLVEDIIVGRTSSDGTLRVRVPSGAIELRAEVHEDAGYRGDAKADLPARGSGEVVILLGEGVHPTYRTELLLREAKRDTLPVSSRSLTLEFLENGTVVPVERLIEVELLDGKLREQSFVTEQFRAERGRIVASNVPALFAALPRNEWIYLSVTGRDTAGVHRHNIVRLRISSRPPL